MKKILIALSICYIFIFVSVNCFAQKFPCNDFTIQHGYVFDGSFENIPKGKGFYSICLEDGSALWVSNNWNIDVDTSVNVVLYKDIVIYMYPTKEDYLNACKNVQYNGIKYEKEIFDFI